MIAAIRFIFQEILASLRNDTAGFSARKLSAFTAVMLAVWLTTKYGDKDNLVELVLTWLGFALLCLGIVTVQQLIDFRGGRSQAPAGPPKP